MLIMNICTQCSGDTSFVYMPRRTAFGSYGNTMVNTMRNELPCHSPKWLH